MKKLKKILSLALALCIIASMFAVANVTSHAFGVVLSPRSQTVDKSVATTCKVTGSFDGSDESDGLTWIKKATGAYWNGASVTSPATYTGNDGDWTVNISNVSPGTTIQFSANANFDYVYNTTWAGSGAFREERGDTVNIYVTCYHSNGYTRRSSTETYFRDNPTCTQATTYYYSCSTCGAKGTEYYEDSSVAEALGHDFTSQVQTDTYLRTPATCTEAATYYYKCSRCSEKGTNYYSYGSQLGHNMDSGTIITAPTPYADGLKRYECQRDGCDYYVDEVLPMLTGIDVTIYYARQVIAENDNNQLLTSNDGFNAAWADFQSAYQAALQYEGVTVTNDNAAAIDAADTALFDEVVNMRNYERLDTSILQTAIALTPEYDSQYYETNSYTLWSTLRAQAQTFVQNAQSGTKTRADAPEMLTLADGLESAYNSLTLKLADFTNLNSALALEQVVNKDLYIDEVRLPLEALLEQVDFTKTIFDQEEVDQLAADIVEAAALLTTETLDYADYTAVDEAIAAANALTPSNYTNFAAVTAAINAVDRTVLRGEQDLVDEMAAAINAALDALIPAPADYTSINNAIAAADALDPAEWYVNYYKVQNLIDSIDWNMDIFHQSEVETMASAIMTAIGELEYVDADYSDVLDAIDRIDDLGDLEDYTESSLEDLDAALAAVQYGITIERQALVDAMADDLNDAIDNMVLLRADYRALEAALLMVDNLQSSNYSNFSIVSDIVNAIIWDKNTRQQSDVDTWTQQLYTAMQNLVPKKANYSAVNSAIATVQDMIDNSEYEYDEDSLQTYYDFLDSLDMDLDIFDQAVVDGYAEAIIEAGNAIEYAAADYSGVDAAVAQAQSLVRSNYVDMSGVDAAIEAVNYTKKVDEQTAVDEMAQAILDAIDALELVSADYSYLDALLEQYEAMNKDYYSAEDVAAVDEIIENTVVRGYKIDRQNDVDTMAQTIYNAISALSANMLPADTTQLNAAVETAMQKVFDMQDEGYDIVPAQLSALYDLIDEAESLEGASIDLQERIDTLTQTILDAADALEFVFTITDDTTAIIEDEFIYGFEEGITEQEILSMISYVGSANAQVVETDNGLGTGSQVIYTDDDGEVLAQFTVIIFGDADGDGWIDMFDVSISCELANYGVDGDNDLLKAIDVTGDGYIDSFDVAVIISIANMENTISQDGTYVVS